jgi:ribosome biogenesis GTPase
VVVGDGAVGLCGVLAAVASGAISERRHQLYMQLLHESNQQKPW